MTYVLVVFGQGPGLTIGNVEQVQGNISISNSRVRNTRGCGLAMYKKEIFGAFVRLSSVSFENVAVGYPLFAGSHKARLRPNGSLPGHSARWRHGQSECPSCHNGRNRLRRAVCHLRCGGSLVLPGLKHGLCARADCWLVFSDQPPRLHGDDSEWD